MLCQSLIILINSLGIDPVPTSWSAPRPRVHTTYNTLSLARQWWYKTEQSIKNVFQQLWIMATTRVPWTYSDKCAQIILGWSVKQYVRLAVDRDIHRHTDTCIHTTKHMIPSRLMPDGDKYGKAKTCQSTVQYWQASLFSLTLDWAKACEAGKVPCGSDLNEPQK